MTSCSSKRALAFVACALLFLPMLAHAVTINPSSQQLTEPKPEVYTFVYSVVNNDPQPRALHLQLEEFSTYLDDRVTFSKEQFVLLSGQTENIQVSIDPHDLGPETHTLTVGVYDEAQKVASFELLITVKGTPVEKFTIGLDARDATTTNAVPLSITMQNLGNIIGYAQLVLTITKGDQIMGTVTYPTTYQLLPGKTVPYDLIYTDTLEPGFYVASVQAIFPTQTINATDQFSVRLDQTTERINVGEDVILTFQSLGNPSTVKYRLVDKAGVETIVGSAVPQQGDIIVATNTLPTGTYDLFITVQDAEQHVVVIVGDKQAFASMILIGVVICIVLYGLYSMRGPLTRRWNIYQLEKEVALRQDEVTKLINRSHRLVDRYTALHARRQQRSRFSAAADQRTR